MIETSRLILRTWVPADAPPFAEINADPQVAYWLGGPAFAADPGQMDRYNDCIVRRGFGRFAVERREDGALIGAVGPMPIRAGLPVSGFEIGWRIAASAWGRGYATEAARAAIDQAFRHGVEELLAFTAETNLRSQAVMAKLGLARDSSRDFDHPNLAEGDPLRRHIVFAGRSG
jgi:RimJ/RimL family protein N-acetyltransferase